MTAVLYLFFAAFGGATGWAMFAYAGLGAAASVGGGVMTTLALGQVHLLATRGAGKAKAEAVETRLNAVEREHKDTAERVGVLEARTDAVETTLNHELTERRDALVSEMKQLEDVMERLAKTYQARAAEPPALSGATAAPREDAALRDMKEALFANRIELHLQPIVSLPQRQAAFYEGFTRLKRPDGSLILPAEFLDAGRRGDLMGVVDNMTLFRCVQIVRLLAQKDRRVGVFCNISTSSLEDDQFFPPFYEHMAANKDLCGALIFELRADRFETRSKLMQENMARLAGLGFRFSLDHAADLSLDLPRLQDAGVRFVKISGQTLIEHLRDPAGSRPVSSINRRLSGEDVSAVFSRYGVTLIAEKMEDEASVVEILEYDIPYGQGHVFGAPRPIKQSLMEETKPPADFVRKIVG